MFKAYKAVLCPRCEGAGITTWEECVDYHKSVWKDYYVTCRECGGAGRMLEVTYHHDVISAHHDGKQVTLSGTELIPFNQDLITAGMVKGYENKLA